MNVELPDGTIIEDVPDGISKADLLIKLHKNGYNIGELAKGLNNSFADDLKSELAANPEKAKIAAFGTAASDLWEGGKQLFGAGDKRAIDANNIIKQASPASALAGNVAMFSGLGMAAPAVNTIKGATAVGGVSGALMPTDNENVLLGKATNAAIGAATGYGATKIGNSIQARMEAKRAENAIKASQNAVRDATLKASQDAGYVVPRSLYSPSFITNRLESLGGKAAIKQDAALKNQDVTNALARKYLGVADDVPLSPDLMEQLRVQHAAPYREAAQLPAQSGAFSGIGVSPATSKNGAQLVDAIKKARDDSRAAWKAFNSGNAANPTEMRQIAENADSLVARLESELDALATSNNKPDLVSALRESRKNIAKVHSVDRALNDATGDISASNLASQLNKNVPLTDEAKTIASFAQAFPQVSQNGARVPAPGVSKLEALVSMLSGGAGGAMFGPAGVGAAALPFASHGARKLAVSKLLEKTPQYKLNQAEALAEALLASRYSPMAITGGALPSLAQ